MHRITYLRLSLGALLAFTAAACTVGSRRDSVDPPPPPREPIELPPVPPAPFFPESTNPLAIDLPSLVAPDRRPPPLSGGTLFVSPTDTIVVTDPARDLVHVLESGGDLIGTAELLAGDEPGRIDGGDRFAFLALRSAGAVAQVDLATAQIVSRFPVCPAPRGVDFVPASNRLYVACLEGGLWVLDATSGRVDEVHDLGRDLRDVVVTPERIFVSRFRTAEVLVLEDGLRTNTFRPAPFDERSNSGWTRVRPAVAYRMIALPEGRVALVHQYARTGTSQAVYYGPNPLVQAGVTVLDGLQTRSARLRGGVLPVDLSFSHSSADCTEPHLVVVDAGAIATGRRPATRLAALEDIGLSAPQEACTSASGIAETLGRRSAIAHLSDGTRVSLSLEPAALEIGNVVVPLPGESTFDAGYELFFGDLGGGIACASCHPEGGEDGQRWTGSFGLRRTQDLRGGILSSAPFHWQGELETIEELLGAVGTVRMGGPQLNHGAAELLASYLDSLPYPPRLENETPAVLRGREVFYSPAAECSDCHNGGALGGSVPARILRPSTEGWFQTPRLLGLGLRAPYMHDGCADTVDDRFDPECGGFNHGNWSGLSQAEQQDLVSFLESL
ncbi:MAG: hypothetical protein AAGF12_09140 [Myxococcota bacterium]